MHIIDLLRAEAAATRNHATWLTRHGQTELSANAADLATELDATADSVAQVGTQGQERELRALVATLRQQRLAAQAVASGPME